jgi:hypothetical protein
VKRTNSATDLLVPPGAPVPTDNNQRAPGSSPDRLQKAYEVRGHQRRMVLMTLVAEAVTAELRRREVRR